MMETHSFSQARQYAANRLEQELSSNLIYHGIVHTREEVVPAVETLAGMEGIQGDMLLMLFTAAWFHDIGFVKQAANHEMIGAQIAQEVLPSFGYSENQVDIVKDAILATVLPQAPTSLLGEILADADLDILGRKNFIQRNGDLRRELALLGKEYTDREWYAGQLKFVEQHTYFTTSARSLRDTQKLSNIRVLRNKLQELQSKV